MSSGVAIGMAQILHEDNVCDAALRSSGLCKNIASLCVYIVLWEWGKGPLGVTSHLDSKNQIHSYSSD